MPFTTSIARYFDRRVRDRGSSILASHAVTILKGNDHEVSAAVQGTHIYHVDLLRERDEVGISCTCPYFETEGECKHVWATLLSAELKGYLQPPGTKRPSLVFTADSDPDGEDSLPDEEIFRLVSPVSPAHTAAVRRPDWYHTLETLPRPLPVDARAHWPPDREIYYALMGSINVDQNVGLRICFRDRLKTGGWGRLKSEDVLIRSLESIPDPLDREILFSFVAPQYTFAYAKVNFQTVQPLAPGRAEIILTRICATGRCILQTSLSESPNLSERLRWDGGKWRFRLTPVSEGQYWRFSGYFYREQERLELSELRFIEHPHVGTDDCKERGQFIDGRWSASNREHDTRFK